jgi:uncharacterized protein (DUF3820 family)
MIQTRTEAQMADQGNVVPFGKYKGRLIEELLIDDPAYLHWLAGQDWFRAKYITLHQVIINRGAEPEETPEHNALQVLFLDDEFCVRFLRRMRRNTDYETILAELEEKRKYLLSTAREYSDRERATAYLSCPIRGFRFSVERAFEESGVDVNLKIWAMAIINPPDDDNWFVGCCLGRWAIEIKPIVSDEYPAVLRQMRASKSTVLFLEEYRGKGATREQFIKTFASAGITWCSRIRSGAAPHDRFLLRGPLDVFPVLHHYDFWTNIKKSYHDH